MKAAVALLAGLILGCIAGVLVWPWLVFDRETDGAWRDRGAPDYV